MWNFAVTLFSYPGIDKEPVPENFRLEEADFQEDLSDGQVLAKTLYLSVDPYLVSRLHFFFL